jgi:hypothetical protein
MKKSFLLLIFKPPVTAGTKFEYVAKMAAELNYTMFVFNGVVYETKSLYELFNISDLITY